MAVFANVFWALLSNRVFPLGILFLSSGSGRRRLVLHSSFFILLKRLYACPVCACSFRTCDSTTVPLKKSGLRLAHSLTALPNVNA